MKSKEIHYPYYCKKCTRTVYFSENDTIDDICKICGNKMEKENPIISHPKDNIKNANRKSSCLTMSFETDTNLKVECPYCHATNVRKISAVSKGVTVGIFGILGMGKVTKQWHCNNCNSDF